MARILCTGNVTLDIINTVDHYPFEDEEIRASAQVMRSGGNAANTALVLAQLRQDVYLSGVVANDQNGHWLKHTLRENGINVDHLREYSGVTPTSYITLNGQNGSRTIVHYRDLAELRLNDFAHLSLERIDWFHFEGRNVEQLNHLLERTLSIRIDQPISLELEKPRDGLEELAHKADVLMVSQTYAEHFGFTDPEPFICAQQKRFPHALISLSWGAEGAWACAPDIAPQHIPATPEIQAVDTIGAGDTFNAGLIDALVSGQPMLEATASACRLAEAKIQNIGLRDFLHRV